MKMFTPAPFRSKVSALLVAAVALAGTVTVNAQSAVSNLGQASSEQNYTVGVGFTGDTYRDTFSFTTGAAATNFAGATLLFSTAAGSPSGLTFGLYSSFSPSAGAGPSGLLSSLSLISGDPTIPGNVSFSGSASLAPSTTYYLSIAAVTSPNGTNYTWKGTTTAALDSGGLAGWSILNGFYNYNTNTTWSLNSGVSPQFSVQASAIPEPSTYAAIAGVAMLGFAGWSRRRRTTPVTVPAANATA